MLIQGVADRHAGPRHATRPTRREILADSAPAGIAARHRTVPSRTYFRGANTTQFGGHSSISMEGATGSKNTGKAARRGGARRSAPRASAAIDLTPGRDARDPRADRRGRPARRTPPAPAPPTRRSPAGTSTSAGAARTSARPSALATSGDDARPRPRSTSPDWYAPLTGDRVGIDRPRSARAFATGGKFTYKVEWGSGCADRRGTRSSDGESTTHRHRLRRASTWTRSAPRWRSYTPPARPGRPDLRPVAPTRTRTSSPSGVTVDGDGIADQRRRPQGAHRVPDGQRRCAPASPSGWAPAARRRCATPTSTATTSEELIVPLEDGTIHAYRPDGTRAARLAGQTRDAVLRRPTTRARPASTRSTPRASRRAAPTIADLDDDGSPEVITAAGAAHLRVARPTAALRDGFPVATTRPSATTALQRKENSVGGAWHRKCGFLATPGGRRGSTAPDKPFIDRRPGARRPPLRAAPGRHRACPASRSTWSTPTSPARRADVRRVDQPTPRSATIGGGAGRRRRTARTTSYGADQRGLRRSPGGVATCRSPASSASAAGTGHARLRGRRRDRRLPARLADQDSRRIIQNVLPLIGPGPRPGDHRGRRRRRASSSRRPAGRSPTYNAGRQRVEQRRMTRRATLRSTCSSRPPSATCSAAPATRRSSSTRSTLGQAANLLLVGQNFAVPAHDRRVGLGQPARRCRATRRSPTTTSSCPRRRSRRSTRTARRTRCWRAPASGCCTPTTARPAATSPGFPKVTGGWLFAPAALSDDGRMAGITREGFLFEWEHRRAAVPVRVAVVPPRPAGQRQLRPRRHRAGRAREPHADQARRRLATASRSTRRATTRCAARRPGTSRASTGRRST